MTEKNAQINAKPEGWPKPAAAVVGILAFGLVLDLIGILPIADHWTNMAFLLMEGREISDAFKPLYIPEAVVYALRPLAFTLLKILWSFFDPTDWGLNFVKGLTLPLFGWASYRLMSVFGDRKAAFWAALAAMLLPPILYSGWLIGEFDILGGACIYLGVFYIHKLSEGKGSAADWVLFSIFAFLSACTKETTAAFFLIFYLAYLFYRLVDKKAVRPWHFAVAVAYVAAIFLIFLPMSKVPTYMGSLKAMRPPLSFIVIHNFIQAYCLVGAAGVTIFMLSAVKLWFRKDVNETPLWPLTPILTAVLLFFPVTVTYSHYEATFFDPMTMPQLYSFVLVFVLAVIAFLGRGERRLFSLMTFGCLFPGTLSPILLTFSRDDVSSRIYTLCAPLMIYLAISFLLEWLPVIQNAAGARRAALKVSFWALAVLFGYFFVAAGFNFAQEYRTRIIAEYQTKEALSAQELENSYVYFNNFPYQVGEADILVARGQRHTTTLFFQLLETQNADDDPDIVKSKVCYYNDVAGKENLKHTYYYWLSPKSLMSEKANKVLRGDFRWTETDGYPFLKPFEINAQDRWSYGPIRNHRSGVYLKKSAAERMAEENGDVLYEKSWPYIQIPTWPNDIVRRVVSGVSLVERYVYEGKVFKLDPARLNCPESGS